MSEHSVRQYSRLRNCSLNTTRGLLTLRGPSPPRMQVATHLDVHCSALADFGCLILTCALSSPADALTRHDRQWSCSSRADGWDGTGTGLLTGERGRDVGEGLRLRRRRGEDGGRERERHHGRRLREAEPRHPPAAKTYDGTRRQRLAAWPCLCFCLCAVL